MDGAQGVSSASPRLQVLVGHQSITTHRPTGELVLPDVEEAELGHQPDRVLVA